MGHQAPYCGILYELGIGVWPSMVGRYVRDVEVGGSNPLTPTTFLCHESLSPIAIAALVISFLAFGFAVLSFWWMHWRASGLKIAISSTYQGYAGVLATSKSGTLLLRRDQGDVAVL